MSESSLPIDDAQGDVRDVVIQVTNAAGKSTLLRYRDPVVGTLEMLQADGLTAVILQRGEVRELTDDEIDRVRFRHYGMSTPPEGYYTAAWTEEQRREWDDAEFEAWKREQQAEAKGGAS